MISKRDILKMVRKVSRRSDGGFDHRLIHPEREWFIIILTAVIIMLAGLSYTAWLFQKYSTLEEDITTGNSSVVSFDRYAFDAALESYREKADNFDNLIHSDPVIIEIEVATTSVQSTETASSTEVTNPIPAEDTPEIIVKPESTTGVEIAQ